VRASFPEGVALAVAAVVLVVAIVGVTTRDTSKTSSGVAVSASASPSSTPQETASRDAAAAPAGSGEPAPRPPAPAPPVASGPVRPPAAVPPKPGHYDYSETNSNGTRQSTLVIASQGGGKQTENTDDETTVDEVQWRSNGKFERATTFSFPNGSFRCVWNPEFVEYKFPLRTGSSWTVHTTCHPNAQSSITLDATSRVTGRERRSVAGAAVDAWVIVTDATIKFAGNGASFSEAIRDEDHFAPAYGLTVHEVAVTTDTDPTGVKSRDTTTRDLLRLKPTQQA